MISWLAVIWPQPLDPLHSVALSALVAALPLILVLVLMVFSAAADSSLPPAGSPLQFCWRCLYGACRRARRLER